MNKKRMIPSFRPQGAGMARAVLRLLPLLLVGVPVFARTEGRVPGTYADRASRTCTWSLYGEGGLPWAAGVRYPNLNARRSLDFSPAVGGGVDFTLRPWVRFGAEYLWSRWRREQRPTAPEAGAASFKAYGSRLTDGHRAGLHAEFNLAGSRDKVHRFNVWAGTGVGLLSGMGNDYSLVFSTTRTQDGTTVPVDGSVGIGNEGNVTVTGRVQAANGHFTFLDFVIPAILHFELDLGRQWTAGVKGEADFLPVRDRNAPKQLFSALFTLRYHFVPGRAKALTRYYEGEIDRLEAELEELREKRETLYIVTDESPAGCAGREGQEAEAGPVVPVGDAVPAGNVEEAGPAGCAGREGQEAEAGPAAGVN